jgi:hypothetical protein
VSAFLRFPPKPEPGESLLDWEARALRPWRMEMKRKLLAERGRMCERGCGNPAQDLDEGLLTRGDMRGLSLEKRRLAFGEPNLFLLCRQCNRHEAHDREGAFLRACQRYGEETVRAWYASLELKAPRADWLSRKD